MDQPNLSTRRRFSFKILYSRLLATVCVLFAQISTAQQPDQASVQPTDQKAQAKTGQSGQAGDILNLDIEALGKIEVRPSGKPMATGTGNVIGTGPGQTTNAGSLGDVLNEAPGVSVRRTSAINLDPRVRGLHSMQLNATADGMNQLKARIDVDSLLSQIDPGVVTSIEVIDGPYSSLYGPGFAFLIAEMSPTLRYPGGPEYHASTVLSHATNGRQIYNRETFWGGGTNWGFLASYGLRTGNDYSPGSNGYSPRIPASYRVQDAFLNLGVDPTRNTRIDFDYVRQDIYGIELPGVAYDLRRSATDQFNVRFTLQENQSEPEKLVVQFWEQRTLYHGDSSRESKQLSFNALLIQQPNPDQAGGSLLNQGLSESKGVRSFVVLGEKDSLQLTAGADWRRYLQHYREEDLTAQGEVFFGGNIFGIPQSSIETIGLFGHVTDPIRENLNVTLGGRVDWTQAFIDAGDVVVLQAPTEPTGFYRPGFAEPRDTLLMGYTTADWRPTAWLGMHGGVGFAMRNAGLAELYSDEPYVPLGRFGNAFVDGNSQLSPEKNIQFDVGITGKWDYFQVGIRGFHSTIYDYILAVPSNFSTFVPAGVAAPAALGRNYSAFGVDPTDPTIQPAADTASLAYRYTNLDRVRLFGSELFSEYRVLEWLAVNASLTYVRGINESPVRFDDNTGQVIQIKDKESLPGVFPLSATIGVRIFEPCRNKWSVEFTTRMVDRQDHVADSLAELPTPGFAVFGIQGHYQYSERVRIFSSIDNLLDRSYFQHGSLAISSTGGLIDFVREPGFNWLVGVEAKF